MLRLDFASHDGSAALPAKADIALSSFSFSGVSGTTSAVTPFDATLGTLNSVNVLITGQLF